MPIVGIPAPFPLSEFVLPLTGLVSGSLNLQFLFLTPFAAKSLSVHTTGSRGTGARRPMVRMRASGFVVRPPDFLDEREFSDRRGQIGWRTPRSGAVGSRSQKFHDQR